ASPEIIARVQFELPPRAEALLYAAGRDKEFCTALLECIARRRPFPGTDGELRAVATPYLRHNGSNLLSALEPAVRQSGTNNSTVAFGDKFFLKLFGRLEMGVNPELEFARFLTEHNFPNVPPVVGSLEYRRNNGESFAVAILSR